MSYRAYIIALTSIPLFVLSCSTDNKIDASQLSDTESGDGKARGKGKVTIMGKEEGNGDLFSDSGSGSDSGSDSGSGSGAADDDGSGIATDDAGDGETLPLEINSFHLVDEQGTTHDEKLERLASASGSVAWNVSGDGTCELFDGETSTGETGLTGEHTFENVTTSRDFTIKCDAAESTDKVEKSLKLLVWHKPAITLELEKNNTRSATLSSIGGEPFNVVWSTTMATGCELFARAPGEAAPGTSLSATGLTGSHAVSSLMADRVYTLSCVNTVDGHTETEMKEVTATYLGSWFQTSNKTCTQDCSDRGLTNLASPEGFLCTAGEAVAASAVGKITFTYGCYPSNCNILSTGSSVSVNQYCYRPGQNRDNDSTDRTVGCFCR